MRYVETFPSIGRVRVKHRGILLTLKGTVIRSGAIKMYEGERKYMCQKCKHEWVFFSLHNYYTHTVFVERKKHLDILKILVLKEI